MSRYDLPGGEDAGFQPGSNRTVLRNRLGITSVAEIEVAETLALASAEDRVLGWFEDDTAFTSSLICQLHREWLGEVYSFAGSYRQVNLSKGSLTFCPAQYVPANMERLERELLQPLTPCKGLELDETCDRVAQIHAEFLLIHPFREGNGRLARWIASLMILQAGFPPPVYDVRGRAESEKRDEYFDALRKGYYDRDVTELSQLFRRWITAGRAR